MMGLLARREHSRLELLQKMLVKSFETELINSNIGDFIEHDWQSDHRYAEMMLRSRILKCHGPVKIKMELKQKGISADIIQQCFDKDVNWFELATDALNKRFSATPTSQKEKNKQYRFLQQRGFTHEQVKQAVKE